MSRAFAKREEENRNADEARVWTQTTGSSATMSYATQVMTASEQFTLQSLPSAFRGDINHQIVDLVQQSEETASKNNPVHTKAHEGTAGPRCENSGLVGR